MGARDPGLPRWRVVDGEVQAAANPRSFFIPSLERRTSLGADDLVKLVFEVVGGDDEGAGERMWVRVTDTAPGGYVGTLENEPIVIDGLWPGARVEFEPRHVIGVWDDEPDPLEGLAAFASARLLEDDALEPGVVTFDPDHDGHELEDGRTVTGWELFVGDETPAELDDPERIRIPSLAWLVQRYPELLELVDAHDGSETSWIRDETGTLVVHEG
jgi:hypothetical protein